MLQAGPVVNVHLPKDRISMTHQGFGFCEFQTEEDAEYACKIMNQIKLFGKPIRVNKASSDRKQIDIGANLFVGNLDPNVDERMLFDTFMAFGTLVQPPKVRFMGSEVRVRFTDSMNFRLLCRFPVIQQQAPRKVTGLFHMTRSKHRTPRSSR